MAGAARNFADNPRQEGANLCRDLKSLGCVYTESRWMAQRGPRVTVATRPVQIWSLPPEKTWRTYNARTLIPIHYCPRPTSFPPIQPRRRDRRGSKWPNV